MRDEEKDAIRQQIQDSLEETREHIADLVELTRPIPPENSIGRLSRMEAINSKSVNEAALRQARNRLAKLEHALAKVDSEEFGICVRCKQEIGSARLLFIPETTTCVKCAR